MNEVLDMRCGAVRCGFRPSAFQFRIEGEGFRVQGFGV